MPHLDDRNILLIKLLQFIENYSFMAHPIVAYVIELVFVVVVAHRFTDNRLHGRSNNIVVVSDYLTPVVLLHIAKDS